MDELLDDIVAALRQNQSLTPHDVDYLMRVHNGRVAQAGADRPFTKRRLMPYFLSMPTAQPERWAAWALTPEEIRAITALLQVKPRRSMSGVATITLITRPAPCRGTCIFCPTEPDMPKSYLANEPACQRAVQAGFDPYLQVTRRLKALAEMGHPTSKIELIILGGTWDDYPPRYRIRFVTRAFQALNDFSPFDPAAMSNALTACHEGGDSQKTAGQSTTSYDPAAWLDAPGTAACAPTDADFATLFAEQERNSKAVCRCVGLVVETRPDCVTRESLAFARALGATKIQMGVQTLDEDILRANGRPITQDCIANAFALLREFGFKSHVHVMLNLLGSTPERDLASYHQLMTDERFRPDEVKLYPCMLIRGTALERAWQEGRWVPYTHDELTGTLARCLEATPPWTRVSRMIRDFSAGDIVAGDRTANLRQEVEARAKADSGRDGTILQEMRVREIVGDVPEAGSLRLDEVPYETSTSHEIFLQWVTPESRLAGFLRLSLPKDTSCAMIREVHVYGRTAAVGSGAQNAQHHGLGRQLVERAAGLAREAGYTRVAVISAVGTRQYYKHLGFSPISAPSAAHPETLYQYRSL